MSDFVRYESEAKNLSWEKNKVTGETRNEKPLHTLEVLKAKLAKAKNQVAVLEKAIANTEAS